MTLELGLVLSLAMATGALLLLLNYPRLQGTSKPSAMDLMIQVGAYLVLGMCGASICALVLVPVWGGRIVMGTAGLCVVLAALGNLGAIQDLVRHFKRARKASGS